MSERKHNRLRLASAVLAIGLLFGAVTSLSGCSGASEVPKGYQYATAPGEYFRLFVPTQWSVNTASGVSGAILSLGSQTSVTMAEIPFDPVLTDEQGEARTATLDDFVEAHVSEISTMHNYRQEKRFNSTLGSGKAVDMTYFATVNGVEYRFRQVLAKAGGRFYLFTYSALADQFEQNLDTVDEILENVLFYTTPYEAEADKKIPEDKNTPDGMKLVSTNEVAYRFYVPVAWELDAGNAANLVFIREADGSRSNVSMMAYMPGDDGFSVADYWDMCLPQYEDALQNFTVLSETEETMGDRKATVWEYTYTLGGVTYTTRQAACVYTTMIYTMTYTVTGDITSAHYTSHLEDVKAMQAAITFRSPLKRNG